MAFVGIDAVIFGAPDLKLARQFCLDWGLRKKSATRSRLVFATQIGSEVIVQPQDSSSLPSRVSPHSNFREVIWGVQSQREVDAIGKDLARDREVRRDADGTIHTVDDAGINIGLRVWRHGGEKKSGGTQFNVPGDRGRIDRIAPFHQQAHPYRMGHIVFFAPNVKQAEAFYRKRLGFWLSDRYAGEAGVFLRWAARSDHHNLFFIKARDGNTDLHHIAFEVSDVHEVFAGGIRFGEKGWQTAVGPGRHPISSAYFWYFKNPLGGSVEYFSDPDFVTPKWKPHNYRVNRFSEWHLLDGIKRIDDGVVRPSLNAMRAMPAPATRT